MKNRRIIKHGMLPDLKKYLERAGWVLEEPKGKYEVLRARNAGYPRPLLIHDRNRGCGYSIDERDSEIYKQYIMDRESRGLEGCWETQEERDEYFRRK